LPRALIAALFIFAACNGEREGIRLTPSGGGPRVSFDLDARPLPEIPFPNDLATRPDPTAATGRRVNASKVAPTALEIGVRSRIDTLDGFGTYQPITVSFDQPLDIENLLARHRDNLDFQDDAVYLVDIDPKSPDFGEKVLLDIGRGNYPLLLKQSDRYYPADARGGAGNLLFDTADEDLNGNGILDPGEDSDDDGILDRPNVWPPGEDLKDGLMTFYELETDTLILKPVVPLRERTTYAVVLTERLLGFGGRPVRSPFIWVHHLDQTEELERLQDAGIAVDEVAFAWTFTTQSVTADLVAVREGLYGIGPLKWLAKEFPADLVPDRAKSQGEEPPHYILETEKFIDIIEVVGPSLFGGDIDDVRPLMDTYHNAAYLVSGAFKSPDFLNTSDYSLGENVFDIDLQNGTARVEEAVVPFLMVIPKENQHHHPPYPVAIYAHGYSGARFEILGFAGTLARYGIATIGIDSWGSGLGLEDYREIIESVAESWGLVPFFEAFMFGRARDLTGDGRVNPGGHIYTSYGFQTRDVLRQSVIDYFQLIRILRTFDGQKTWRADIDGDGKDDIAGDFDGDGVVDAGGPGVEYFAWGQSMGGKHSSILGAMEPAVIAITPGCGGGGLADVGMRTMLSNVRDATVLRVMGPLIVGEARGAGVMRVSLLVPISNESRKLPLGDLSAVSPGDSVLVENLTKCEEHWATVREGPQFRVSMEADAEDTFRVTFFDPAGGEIARLDRWEEEVWYRDDQPAYFQGQELRTPAAGFGMARCTPDMRRMVALFQMILDPADPANYGRYFFEEPLDIRPEGPTVTNFLKIATLGDSEVPIGTQAALARAAGVIPYLEENDKYGMSINDWLISNYVYEGITGIGRFPENDILFDPDDVDENTDGHDAPAPPADKRLRMKVPTPTGVSGIRFAYVNPTGEHGIYLPDPTLDFDMDTYYANLIGMYFLSSGTEILDDFCLQDASCPLP
jgi:hypothetical protein